jgi:hypothetical protein
MTPEERAEAGWATAAQAAGNAAQALNAAKETIIDGKAVPIPTTAPFASNPGALGTYSGQGASYPGQNPYSQQGTAQQGYSQNPNAGSGYGQQAAYAGANQQQAAQQGYATGGQQTRATVANGAQQDSAQQGAAQGAGQGAGGQQQGSGIPWGKVLGSAASAAVNAATAGRRLLRE